LPICYAQRPDRSLSALGVRDREASDGVGPVGDGVDKRGEPATGNHAT